MTALILMAAGLMLLVADFGDGLFDWWILALILLLTGAWLDGWLSPRRWVAGPEESARLDRLDADIEAHR